MSLHRSIRKVSLLRTLARLNDEGIRPTATGLVRADDTRQSMPSDTLTARRLLVNDLRKQGLIQSFTTAGTQYAQLKITEQGVRVLADRDGAP